MEKKKPKNNWPQYLILSFICICLGSFLLFLSTFNKKNVTVSYDEEKNVDYKVYLKQNNFFETPYLTKGSTYISSLIDHLDITVDYKLNYSTNVTGTYSYYTKAIISADKATVDKGTYWSKEYILTDPITQTIVDKDSFQIQANNKINYQVYSEILNSFKREYNVSMDGNLKFQLVVSSDVVAENMTKPIQEEKTIEISMPLTEQSVDISINTNLDDIETTRYVTDTISVDDIKYIAAKIVGILLLVVALVYIILGVRKIIKVRKSISSYTKTVNKILSTYNSIIVNTKTIFDLKSYDVINVNSFEELIDAHSEVRMPINYVTNNKGCAFILIHNKMAWVYALKKSDDDEKAKE